jgi:hypothetical protein
MTRLITLLLLDLPTLVLVLTAAPAATTGSTDTRKATTDDTPNHDLFARPADPGARIDGRSERPPLVASCGRGTSWNGEDCPLHACAA